MNKKKSIYYMMLYLCLGMVFLSTGCGSNEEVIYMEGSENMSEASVTEETETEGTTEIFGGGQPRTPGLIVVHVCGAVQESGVYELQEDSRVIDAVAAAGGLTDEADAEYVNLAAVIADGDKVRIPTKQEVQHAMKQVQETGMLSVVTSVGEEMTEGESPKVNINTADTEELCTLPGIGRTRAAAIQAYRQETGGFSTIEEIMQVSGIKESSFQKIKDLITVN